MIVVQTIIPTVTIVMESRTDFSTPTSVATLLSVFSMLSSQPCK